MNTTGPVMTVTDELLAELAQELNRCKFSDDGDGDESWPSISGEAVSALITELRRLRAENAELAKDAGRLEWMVAEGAVIARMNGTGRPMCYQVSFPFESCQQLDWFPSWREAVDAMMAAQ